ncbi:hypothetical protein BASA62_001307 [Batrachochytrium salamandrivorans]|nr:hypothetical protein BASA62_001307 [Batrachochytrium salamandrivorans]
MLLTIRGSQLSLRRQLSTGTRPLFHNNPLGLPPIQHQHPKERPASKFNDPNEPKIPRSARGLPVQKPIANVSHVIAVASGKGGVGKSTTSVNLAVALAGLGQRVGPFRCRYIRPIIPKMMNLKGQPCVDQSSNEGIRTASTGKLTGQRWIVLVIDMPPGTGDTQLTITHQIPLSGAIIVSTPQDVALLDAIKGANMFKIVETPILGMVQNMSFYCCPKCNHQEYIFGKDGVVQTAKTLGLDILADMPLHSDVVSTSDSGKPITVSQPDSIHAQKYREMARTVIKKLCL